MSADIDLSYLICKWDFSLECCHTHPSHVTLILWEKYRNTFHSLIIIFFFDWKHCKKVDGVVSYVATVQNRVFHRNHVKLVIQNSVIYCHDLSFGVIFSFFRNDIQMYVCLLNQQCWLILHTFKHICQYTPLIKTSEQKKKQSLDDISSSEAAKWKTHKLKRLRLWLEVVNVLNIQYLFSTCGWSVWQEGKHMLLNKVRKTFVYTLENGSMKQIEYFIMKSTFKGFPFCTMCFIFCSTSLVRCFFFVSGATHFPSFLFICAYVFTFFFFLLVWLSEHAAPSELKCKCSLLVIEANVRNDVENSM